MTNKLAKIKSISKKVEASIQQTIEFASSDIELDSENGVVSYDELEKRAQALKTTVENLVKEEVKN